MRILFGLTAAAALLLAVRHSSAGASLSVTSGAYVNGGRMPLALSYNANGCTGDNVSPDLRWSGAPAGTKSFALTLWDPDAPHPGGWWHWVAFDIPARAHGLPSGAGDPKKSLAPPGTIEGTNDFPLTGYDGPCPPPGDRPHHYVLTLYALDVPRVAGARRGTTGPQLQRLVRGHVLARAVLVGRFGR